MKWPSTRRALFMFLMLASFSSVSHAQRTDCPTSKAEQAETRAGMVRSWDALYSWYKEYRACDDGVIAETSGAAVGNLLASHWDTLPTLGRIAKSDVEFRRFVIVHFGWTIEMQDIEEKDVESIKKNAKMQCPTGLHELCRDLWHQADSALKAATSAH